MDEKSGTRIREKWIDAVKVIACILVVLGHFFQSMIKSNVLPENHLYVWFDTTIYYFHVPLFFICSGYLYQKYSKVNNISSWYKNVTKKVLTLGIPYVTFTTITWILKKLFSNSVNDPIGGFGDTLLFHPTAPYWYLYSLFLIFFITPTFSSVKMAVIELSAAVIAKLLTLNWGCGLYAISTVLSNEIWFVLGMSVCAFDVKIKGKKLQGIASGLLFLLLSIAIYSLNIKSLAISFAMGLLACTALILIVVNFEDRFRKGTSFLAKYTMPIFLMHTLFAAPIRSALLKFGIKNAAIHVVMGLVGSFVGPIIAAWIMKKTKWLEFFLYPDKYINGKSVYK